MAQVGEFGSGFSDYFNIDRKGSSSESDIKKVDNQFENDDILVCVHDDAPALIKTFK